MMGICSGKCTTRQFRCCEHHSVHPHKPSGVASAHRAYMVQPTAPRLKPVQPIIIVLTESCRQP